MSNILDGKTKIWKKRTHHTFHFLKEVEGDMKESLLPNLPKYVMLEVFAKYDQVLFIIELCLK